MQRRFAPLVLLMLAAATGAHAAFNNSQWTQRTRPMVIGHRGSPAYVPEHTLESYRLAIFGGVDFVECDVVLTKDLVPVCRHEPMLGLTTDALDKFPDKVANYTVDGSVYEDVFSVDLTLEEVRTLRARQKDSFRPLQFDGEFKVITLEEQIQMVMSAARAGRIVGIYPELKHPTFHNTRPEVQAADTTIQDIVLEVLTKYNYTGPYNSPEWRKQPVFIQSFEQDDLADLSTKTCIPLIQLLDSPGFVTPDRNKTYEEMITDESLDDIASYAAGAGPWKNMLVEEQDGKLVSTGLVERLHERGVMVHTYTMRPEPQYVDPLLTNTTNFYEWDLYFKELGVDGAFADHPTVLASYMEAQRVSGYVWPSEYQDRWNSEPECSV